MLVAAAAAAAAAMEAARGSIETRQQQQPCAYTRSEQVSCCGATATSRSTLQVMAPFGAGILLDAGVRCKRLTVCAKGAPDRAVTAVHIGLAQRASRAELCAFCECWRTAPGLLCCCCALRPALSCRSCVRPSRWRQRCAGTCAPAALVLHHTHPVLRALCRSRSRLRKVHAAAAAAAA